jgi:stearoyl-CoA desaturase (delta-9 desaturase)
MGWMFVHPPAESRDRLGRDLVDDPMISFFDRTFLFWSVMSFVLPFGLGYALTGTWGGAFTGLLWGGLVRLFLNHHITWSVNSICHFFGRRPFAAYDQSTNNWLLAIPSLGEAWHHNHHVFHTSAFHGLSWRQVDISGWLIAGWEKLGLVRNVRRVSPEQMARKLARAQQAARHAES